MSVKLTPEEIKAINLTEDDENELHETATIGLSPNENDEYYRRMVELEEERLKQKAVNAQCLKIADELRCKRHWSAKFSGSYWFDKSDLDALIADLKEATK